MCFTILKVEKKINLQNKQTKTGLWNNWLEHRETVNDILSYTDTHMTFDSHVKE